MEIDILKETIHVLKKDPGIDQTALSPLLNETRQKKNRQTTGYKNTPFCPDSLYCFKCLDKRELLCVSFFLARQPIIVTCLHLF